MNELRRREFLKLIAAGLGAAVLQPRFLFAQGTGTGGQKLNIIPIFLFGGCDPRYLFPFLAGPVHNEFIKPGGLRGETTYPRSGVIEHILASQQSGRANPVGFNGGLSSLLSAARTTGCGVSVVTEFGVTELESLSHETATKHFQVGQLGPGGDPSLFKQGWLARLIDVARLPAMSVWGCGLSDPIIFNAVSQTPMTISSAPTYGFTNRSEPSPASSIGDKQFTAANDSVLTREFIKQLAEIRHPEIPFDQLMSEVFRGVNSTVGLMQQIVSNAVINPIEFGDSDFGRTMQDIARVLRYTNSENAPAEVQRSSNIIATGLGGWDAHESLSYALPPVVKSLSDGLAGLILHLKRYNLLQSTVITVMTEFGRTLRENGTYGMDHGRASYALVLGGGVKSSVLGPDPELSLVQSQNTLPAQVPFTALLRQVLGRAGFDNATLNQVFPAVLRNEGTVDLKLFA